MVDDSRPPDPATQIDWLTMTDATSVPAVLRQWQKLCEFAPRALVVRPRRLPQGALLRDHRAALPRARAGHLPRLDPQAARGREPPRHRARAGDRQPLRTRRRHGHRGDDPRHDALDPARHDDRIPAQGRQRRHRHRAPRQERMARGRQRRRAGHGGRCARRGSGARRDHDVRLAAGQRREAPRARRADRPEAEGKRVAA